MDVTRQLCDPTSTSSCENITPALLLLISLPVNMSSSAICVRFFFLKITLGTESINCKGLRTFASELSTWWIFFFPLFH